MPTCRNMSRHILLLAALLLAHAACGGDEVASGDVSDSCVVAPTTIASDTGTVLVRGSEGLCTLAFRELVTLRGEAEGTGALPRPPIALGPRGTFLTGTYEGGRIAVWSPSGELVRVFGMGEGEGPGEFDLTNMLVDTVAGIVYIMSGTHFDVYSTAGEYLRQINLPAPPALGAVLGDGTIVTTVAGDGSGPRLMIVRDDSVTRAGPPQRFFFPAAVVSGGDGVWTSEAPWYEINRHAVPDGRIDLVVRREDPRFPPPANDDPGNASAHLFGFAVDAERVFVLTRVVIPDPDAPPVPAPRSESEGGGPIAPMTPEERRESSRARSDGVVEVFTLDGRLIASTTYDQPEDAPWPISAGVWYRRLDDDLRSIQLLEPILTAHK